MLNLRALRPINYAGDYDAPLGPRPRVDWLVLAMMLTDLILFAVHLGPRLWARATSAGGFVFLMLFLFLAWLGPFLGMIFRRGRGAAMLCYGVQKLAITVAMLAWWWANRAFDETRPLPAAWLAWHAFGLVLVVLTLQIDHRRRRTRHLQPA